jgi:hypothetical protein
LFVSETSWVAPAEGFVSVEEQAAEETGDSATTSVDSSSQNVPGTSSAVESRTKQKPVSAAAVAAPVATAQVPDAKPNKPKPPVKKQLVAASEPPACQWWNAKLNDPLGAWQPAEPLQKPK